MAAAFHCCRQHLASTVPPLCQHSCRITCQQHQPGVCSARMCAGVEVRNLQAVAFNQYHLPQAKMHAATMQCSVLHAVQAGRSLTKFVIIPAAACEREGVMCTMHQPVAAGILLTAFCHAACVKQIHRTLQNRCDSSQEVLVGKPMAGTPVNRRTMTGLQGSFCKNSFDCKLESGLAAVTEQVAKGLCS